MLASGFKFAGFVGFKGPAKSLEFDDLVLGSLVKVPALTQGAFLSLSATGFRGFFLTLNDLGVWER